MMVSMLNGISILAIETDDYINIYKQYDGYFSNFSIVKQILRSLGWLALRGMLHLVDMLSTLLNTVFEFINFLDSEEIQQIFNTVKPFIWTVFLFALIYLAYCYIYAHEKPKGIVTNLFLFFGTVMILPYMMTQMTSLVTFGKEALSSEAENGSYTLLVPYITDLLYLDSIDFDADKIEKGNRNGFSSQNGDNIRYLDINEVLDPADYTLQNKKLFKKQLTSEIKRGKEVLTVSNIRRDFYIIDTTPFYYRYSVNFFVVFLYLFAVIVVLSFSSMKLISLIFELAAEKIFAPFIAAGDITGGQKARKALIGILNGYIAILGVLFLQKLFILATTYINNKTWNDNSTADGFIKAFMILAGAFFVIDGPNFFEQIFGVDAGLKSVGQALQTAYYGSQMLGGIGRGAAGIVNKAKHTASKAAGKAAETAGSLSGMRDTGVFDSNNEKVSKEMAKNDGAPDFSSGNSMDSGSQLEGGRFPQLPEHSSNTDIQDQMKQEGDSSGKDIASNAAKDGNATDAYENTDMSGIQNLSSASGTEQNRDVNKEMNRSLNQSMEENWNSDTNQEIHDAMHEGTSGQAGLESKDGTIGTASDRAGRQNLEGARQKGDRNQEIADALNNGMSPEKSGASEEVYDPENVVEWAMKNTSAGRYLKDSFDRGKSFGHALGNTINNANRKKQKKQKDSSDSSAGAEMPRQERTIYYPPSDVVDDTLEKNNSYLLTDENNDKDDNSKQ